jgi:hypothetical protein
MKILHPTHHEFLVYEDLKMLIESHHPTREEINEGLKLYYLTKDDPDIILVRPDFKPSVDARGGTPVERLQQNEDDN